MSTSLAELVNSPRAPIEEIEAFLDRLDHDSRVLSMRALGRNEQRLLYEKASASPKLTINDLAGDAGECEEVINEGLNTLPFPAALRRFQKRVCRPSDSATNLFGYNEGPTRKLIGPGYFVAKPTAGDPRWESRGGVVVDYFEVPRGEVAKNWPRVVDNSEGMQRFVFRNTRDFLRKVSSSVFVGAAYKFERPLDHYFVLCRKPLG